MKIGVTRHSERPPPAASSRTTSRRAPRHVLLVSLLVSALVHALVLSIPFGLEPPHAEGRGEGRTARSSTGSMHALNLRAEAEAEAGRAKPSTPTAPQDTTAAPIPFPIEAVPGSAPVGRRPTAAELLRPHALDSRLWPSAPTEPLNPTAPETMRLEDGRSRLNRDAAGVHVPPGGDMSVWTARDGENRRWGLSPGAIQLGGLTIPLCSGSFDAASCGFGVQPVFRDAYRLGLRARLEIQRQLWQGELQDRANAMRARLDSLAIRPRGVPRPSVPRRHAPRRRAPGGS